MIGHCLCDKCGKHFPFWWSDAYDYAENQICPYCDTERTKEDKQREFLTFILCTRGKLNRDVCSHIYKLVLR